MQCVFQLSCGHLEQVLNFLANTFACLCVGQQAYEDKDVVGTAVDILMSIADFHCSILRDHILQDGESQSEVSNLRDYWASNSVIPGICHAGNSVI